MGIFERIFIGLTFLFSLLNFIFPLKFGLLSSVLLFLLQIFYFGMSYFVLNGFGIRAIVKNVNSIDSNNTMIPIIGGVLLAILINGILFYLRYWPGSLIMLTIGLVFSTIYVGILVFKNVKQKSIIEINIIKRFALFGIIALILVLIPSKNFVRFKYRNHPKYAEALIYFYDNNSDKEAIRNMENEHKKMFESN
jgi:hypothetical protein